MYGSTNREGLTHGVCNPRTIPDKRGYRLHSLMELSRELTVSLDPFKIVDLILINLMGQVGTSKAAFWKISTESPDSMVPIRRFGVSRQSARAIGTLSLRSFQARKLDFQEPVPTSECGEDLDTVDRQLIEESKLALFAPVISQGELRGMAAFGDRISGEPYDEVDRELIQSCLGLLAVALENASLYNRIREKNRQLREANEGLKQLDRLRSEFIRNVNHELRTPLTVITAYIDILLRQEVDDEQRREFLMTAMKESDKLVGLLEKLLDFSALSSGDFEFNLIEGDLRDFVRVFYADRLPGIVEGLREFVFRADDPLPDACFDPQRARQILDAILENATKFTPQGSQISISVTRVSESEQEWLSINVTDDGPGIPSDRLSDLFLPFHQVDGSTKRTVGGMGIGLSFARDLASKMGGDLRAKSDLGQGAVFSLLLPAA